MMTSTPVRVCIRIRFSEYLAVPAMIPAEEPASSGIKLIFPTSRYPPSVSLHALLIYSEKRKPIDTHTHTLSDVLSSASPWVWQGLGSTSSRR